MGTGGCPAHLGSAAELQLSSTTQRVEPSVAGGGEETNSSWILWWEVGFGACLGVSQLVGWPSPGVVCSPEEKPELRISAECTWLLLQGQLGRAGQSPFPASAGFLLWVEAERGALTSSILGYQMPVAKRLRKSSSDLDQGSPSLTEEENSETSSESEKNSDQVRRVWDALVWRLAGWWGKGCRKRVTVWGGNGLGSLTGF